MKKYVTILAMMICLMFIFGLNAKAATYGDFEYTIKSNGTIDITKYNGIATNLKIPSLIKGKKVSSIGFASFSNCKSLVRIEIPIGVKTIGNAAFFDCINLNYISLPNTVKTIGTEAFYDCPSLKAITIPESVTSIGEYALGFYTLYTKRISDDGLEEESYSTYEKISNFIIKGYIGSEAERYADKNSISFSLTIPKKGSTHKIDKNIYTVTSNNSVSYKAPSSKRIISIKIPKSVKINGKTYKVTAIAKKAFFNCKNLKKVTIKAPIKKIGKYAFYNCKKLKSIRIYSKKLTKSNVLTGAFKGISKKATFYLPKSKKAAYKKILLKRGGTKNMKFVTN